MTPHSHVAGLALAAPAARRESHREIDHPAVERAARDLLRALGADVDAEGLADTPRRVADAYAELLTPQPFRATTFPNEDGYDELIVARAIPFHSLCMHHLLPFHGVAHVGYLPGERIIGLSKLGRVVELFARDVEIQERLTTQIAGWLQRELEPKGVGVVLEAEHLCMSLRGVQKFGSKTYSDVLYVEQLIAPDVINTMPEATLRAFADHGNIGDPLDGRRAPSRGDPPPRSGRTHRPSRPHRPTRGGRRALLLRLLPRAPGLRRDQAPAERRSGLGASAADQP